MRDFLVFLQKNSNFAKKIKGNIVLLKMLKCY